MNEIEVISLIRECLNGNKEAFCRIVQLFQKQIFNLCIHFLSSPQDAEDATMDIFLKAYKSLNSFKPDYKFSTWIFKIAMNHVTDILRKRRREKIIFTEFPEKINHNDLKTPESIFFKNLEIKGLRRAIKKLTLQHQTVLILKYYHELSYEQIGKILNIPRNTVASLIFRAKQELRKKMEVMEVKNEMF